MSNETRIRIRKTSTKRILSLASAATKIIKKIGNSDMADSVNFDKEAATVDDISQFMADSNHYEELTVYLFQEDGKNTRLEVRDSEYWFSDRLIAYFD